MTYPQTYSPAEPATPAPEGKPRRFRKAAVIGGVLLLIGGATAAVLYDRHQAQQEAATAEAAKPASLLAAQTACDPDKDGTEVADGGHTLIIDSRGKSFLSGGLEAGELLCVQQNLQMSQAVVAHMGDTRALDGRQEDQWPGFTASWTYHPDSGLDAIIRTA
jgi:hypothetical protein